MFTDCSNLSYLELPDGISLIGSLAFSGCTSLEHINIPDSVKEIGTYAFERAALSELSIPGSVLSIKPGAFMNCTHLKSVVIESETMCVYDFAFYGCSGLQEVSKPETIRIGRAVFQETPLE